uniref:Uncharacterized protein n=1 Tax=Siphoviridae sp. ctkyH28 TaxID=2827585 RepID=A0A8S5LN08_9CAUD|nr:MAG TPA: hypothetical protein [Siphoviridae sp. ctkyH28]
MKSGNKPTAGTFFAHARGTHRKGSKPTAGTFQRPHERDAPCVIFSVCRKFARRTAFPAAGRRNIMSIKQCAKP